MKTSNKYSDKKIVWFPEKLKSFVTNKITNPIYVRIKPLNLCNHGCFWCVYHADLTKMHPDMNSKDALPKEKFRELLKDLKDIGTKAVTYSGGGEPLMYKGIEEFLQTTLDYDINLSIITHGQFLTDEKAKILAKGSWVRVSMDYWDGASMHQSRRVRPEYFDTVMSNLDNFSKIKNKDCDLAINYIVTKENCNHLFEISKKLKDCGVENIRFSPMWCDNFHEYHKEISNQVFSELIRTRSELSSENFKVYDSFNQISDHNINKRQYKKCYFNQIVPVVGADQNIYTCHNQAYSNDSIVGSIKNKSFKEVWFSDETQKFFDDFNCVTTCTGQCAADSKNKFITELVDSFGDNYV
jgi:MoaA/NifB/PqqE/SkfB family radical SAM enzyme